VVLDAIVVGAGISGLVCARRLVQAGAKIAIFEASDRVGGRLHGGQVGGVAVDLGGPWMTAGQERLAALAAELDVAIERHDRSGRALLDDDGGIVAAFSQWRAMRRIERMMATPDAALDRRSLADRLEREIGSPVARARIALHAELVFATDPASLSLLHYLDTMRATSGFSPQSRDEHGFRGGAHLLAQRLAERLADCIRLGEPVTAIEQAADAITVNGVAARHAVLAIPPPLVRTIAIELPETARRHVDAAFGGPVVKCFAAYARATWGDRGLSGESYHPRGTVRATVALGGRDGEPGVLLGFVVGSEAARWPTRGPDERRADVLATFARLTDEPPLDFVEIDWGSEPWSAGCVPGLPPGARAAGARWRGPYGRLHVAGTESAASWPGYIEGAIDAGERAAREVLAS
jgi:monoamine oxidase